MRKSLAWLGIGLLAGLALIVIPFLRRPHTFRGSLIDPLYPAPEISLTDTDGQSFSLSAQRGKISLIFFGYTACPDVCPATLSAFKRLSDKLGTQGDQINLVFITVDPVRDTSDRMKLYLSGYPVHIIGLTGSLEQLQPTYQAYGVFRQERPVGNSGAYLVDHSTRTYLVDRSGNLRLTYPFEMETEAILQDLLFLLGEKGS